MEINKEQPDDIHKAVRTEPGGSRIIVTSIKPQEVSPPIYERIAPAGPVTSIYEWYITQ